MQCPVELPGRVPETTFRSLAISRVKQVGEEFYPLILSQPSIARVHIVHIQQTQVSYKIFPASIYKDKLSVHVRRGIP